jgi:glycosyltransferase involved in cell wall biosynthesis
MSLISKSIISFIVIGRNEGWRLKKCLNSVVEAIDMNNLDAEIIYIDSQSTDDSQNVAKSISRVKSFVITGVYNAAIARNTGVKEATGDSLVFLDGDMEINPEFLKLIFDEDQSLKYDFVSGNFMNYYYDSEGNFLKKDYYKKIFCTEDTVQFTTGGLFAIKRKHWEEIGGMKPKFKKGQDLDLGYRLSRKGVFLLRKKERMANHHTIDYKDEKRLWKSFFDGTYVYPRAVLYRDHLTNKYVLKRFMTSDPTIGILVLSVITSLLFNYWHFILLYPVLTIIAVLYSMRKSGMKGIFSRLINHILRDILNVFAFLLFYPSNKIKLSYKRVE